MPPAMPTVHPARKGICWKSCYTSRGFPSRRTENRALGQWPGTICGIPRIQTFWTSLSLGDSGIRPAQAGLRIVT
jgi:hypothetical protein